MSYTNVHDAEEFRNSVASILTSVSEIINVTEKPVLLLDRSAGVCAHLKFVFNLKYLTRLDKLVLTSLLNFAGSAEIKSPLALNLFFKIVKNLLNSSITSSTKFDYGHALEKQISSGTMKPTRQDVVELLNKFLTNDVENMRELVMTAIDIAGLDGSIVIERAMRDTDSVELHTGYAFNLTPCFNTVASYYEPRVIMIDGLIESVSEINNILEQFASSKEPGIIFARGFADDVVHTLSVNHIRGSLKVVPVAVPLDIQGLNTLKDIAIIAGADVISNLKGQLINCINYEECSHVKRVNISASNVVIFNEKTCQNVRMHREKLLELRSQNVDFVSPMYDARIKSLSSKHVSVRLKNDLLFVRRSQALDYVLRGVRSLRDYGMINFDTPVSSGKELTSTAYHAVKQALTCVSTIESIGAVVV